MDPTQGSIRLRAIFFEDGCHRDSGFLLFGHLDLGGRGLGQDPELNFSAVCFSFLGKPLVFQGCGVQLYWLT